MSITESLTRVADAQALWTHQLRGKTNVNAITSLFATESQTFETVIQAILTARTLDGAVGTQLDDLGLLVGQRREGRSDERYRIWIKARILANRSSGSPPDMYAIASTILGTGVTLKLLQIPTGHALEAGTFSPVPVDDLWRILQGASSAGVPFWYHYLLHSTSTFTASSTTGWTPTTAQGVDYGRFRGAWGETTRSNDPAGLTVLKNSLERWRLDRFIAEGASITSIDGEYYAEPLAQTGVNTAPTGHLNTLKDAHTEIRFPSSAVDPLITTSTRFVRALRGAWSIAWVGKPRAAAIPPGYLLHATGSTTTYRIYSGTTGTLSYYLDSGTFLASGTFVNVPHVADVASTYVLTYDGAGALTMTVNGVTENVTITHRAEMDTMDFDEFRFGAFQNNYGNSWGSIYDLAIFDYGLTPTEAADLSTYLRSEYLEVDSALSEGAYEYWTTELGFTAASSPNAEWIGRKGLTLTDEAASVSGSFREGRIDAADFPSGTGYLSVATPTNLEDHLVAERPFTVFWYGSRDQLAGDQYVFAAVDTGIGDVISIYTSGSGTNDLFLNMNGNLANFNIAANDTDPHTWIVSYNGGTSTSAWVDGVQADITLGGSPGLTGPLDELQVGGSTETVSGYWGELGCLGILPYAVDFEKANALHLAMRRRFEL